LVGLPSVIDTSDASRNAALIVSGCQECGSAASRGGLERSENARSCECRPAVIDALQILRHLVGLPNLISDGVTVTEDTLIARDTTVTARWTAILPNAPSGFTAKSNAGAVELSWNAVEWADGYEVYRASERLGAYALVGTLTSPNLTRFADSVRAGEWFYTVRAYRVVEGRRLFGEYSAVEGVTVK
jgi:hypothetical protein